MKSRFAAYIFIPSLMLSNNAGATGVPVVDLTNFGQNIMTAANTARTVAGLAKDYAVQIQMLQDQIRQAIGPVTWVFNEATLTYQTVRSYADMLYGLKQSGGSIESYLAQFQNSATYSQNPCFSPKGCSAADFAKLRATEEAASKAEKQANDAQLRGISLGQDQLSTDSKALTAMQGAAKTALSRNEMLGVGNQLSAADVNNGLALRQLLLQQQAADNARAATLANREAMQIAVDKQAMAGRFGKVKPVDLSND
jgi:P-type conjugative transfer protein TrbJ